jgi:ribosomal protein L25 (general stress protein Ctc)
VADELVTIEATERTGTGKGYCRKARKAGKLPANLVSKGTSKLIEFDPKFLSKAYKSEGRFFNLKFGGETRKVHIQELQIDAIKRTPYHVDLVYAD